ncbi:MAG: hypothetical protein KC441_11165 [Anaerolineales bacterium]|nr:hypothetical protein [Anaerolineales bacterium]MCB8987857.1 hypothetical protein [Ardenticatenaceae bacterium]
MRNQGIWVGLGIVVGLCMVLLALFLGADFHMANSETQTNVTTASSRWPSETSLPPQTVQYRVEGDDLLAMALRQALAGQLSNAELAEGTAVPQLIVRIDQERTNWTPVYGRAEIVVTAAFSSNGDFAFMETEPTHFQFNEGDDAGTGHLVQALAEISLTDRSGGLLSRPGYRQLLAEKLAQEVDKALQTQVFAAP